MAILYGTTGDGTTLPVLVDQFGNLLAKGIEGPPGPEGPPGIGQLPPDPYEGAILGWEDGELSWIGGSVPLPAGTYGPYTYIPGDERLDIPQDASALVNGQQIYMSDEKGNQVAVVISTDTIANATQLPLIPFDMPNMPTNGGVWYSRDSGPFAITWSGAVANQDYIRFIWSYTDADRIDIDGDVNDGPFVLDRNDIEPAQGTGVLMQVSASSGTATVTLTNKNGQNNFLIPEGTTGYNPTTAAGYEDTAVRIDLTFPTSNNFDKFEVGDVVQTTEIRGIAIDGKPLVTDSSVFNQDGASITAIDPAGPTITVNGGSWLGADGSGDPNGQTEVSKSQSGSGSVFLGMDGAIVLRNNNKEWVDDFYVTAPEQRIAARKVASAAIRRKKK